MISRYVIGDTRDVTAMMPNGSVDLILTSPPFLALRSYLPADHPDKCREIGSEPTPAEFIDTLLELTAEWSRVLAPHGSLCVELGDTYSGSGGAGGDYNAEGLRDGQQKFSGSAAKRREHGVGDDYRSASPGRAVGAWPLAKSKALIPELYRVALAYGINPLTGRPAPAGYWRVRNVVTWCRPNPPVGALGDKFRPATSDMVIACRSDKRWFDLDAVRGPFSAKTEANLRAPDSVARTTARGGELDNTVAPDSIAYGVNPAGSPPLDFWVIPPGGYQGSHYAVYPPELCRIPILSMCPEKVCTVCGEPSRRIDGGTKYVDSKGRDREPQKWASGIAEGKAAHTLKPDGRYSAIRLEGGWTDCGHNAWRRGITFDPFAGSGTTLMVANGLGRDAIGIDFDERNADLARERCGMFLDVEDMRNGAAA